MPENLYANILTSAAKHNDSVLVTMNLGVPSKVKKLLIRSSTGTEFWPRLMFESRQERIRLHNNTKQRKQVNNSKHISQILIRHGGVREEPSSATVASRVGWL